MMKTTPPVIGFLLIGFASTAQADDILEQTCLAEFDAPEVCACASSRTAAFLETERYDVYLGFFTVFKDRVGPNPESADEIAARWDSAIGRYANDSGQDRELVWSNTWDGEGIYRYAIRACGLDVPIGARPTSIFLWPEAN